MEYINFDSEPEEVNTKPKSSGKKKYIIIGVAAAAVVALGAWGISGCSQTAGSGDSDSVKNVEGELMTAPAPSDTEQMLRDSLEQIKLDLEQVRLEGEYTALEREFNSLETRKLQIRDDKVKQELTDKYNAAKMRVDDLIRQLNEEKKRAAEQSARADKSEKQSAEQAKRIADQAARIAKLEAEIDNLKGILRHYVEEINRLSKENETLRTQNTQLTNDLNTTSSQLTQVRTERENLQERMVLAEKLNVTGVSLQALNNKGKAEKKVDKARQLMVTFTIPQNNSTPTGNKTIYLRIVSPSGELLGNGGSFSFEGGSVPCTDRKTIEYTGQEMPGQHFYWNVNTALSAGEYTVELFTDGYRLTSRKFALQ